MTTPTTASAQIGAAGTALALLTAHPDLPLAEIEFRRFYTPDYGHDDAPTWGLRISVHNQLSHFEQWCERLAIYPHTIGASRRNTTAWLECRATFAGSPVELIGFYDVPESDKTDSR